MMYTSLYVTYLLPFGLKLLVVIGSVERCLPEAMLVSFGAQVAGFGGLSWRFGWPFGVYVGSCEAQMKVWEVQRPQGRGLEGLGLAQGRLGTRIWVQHGPNLSQVGGLSLIHI